MTKSSIAEFGVVISPRITSVERWSRPRRAPAGARRRRPRRRAPPSSSCCDRGLVGVAPLGLRDRPLVPVELEPAQRVEDLLDVLGRRALAVGVLDAQDELAALAAREEPVVQCRPRAADVQHARRRRRETYPHRPFDANWRPRLDGRRPRGGARARRRARLRGDPGLQPVAAHVAADALEAGRRRRVPRADEERARSSR